MSAGARDPSSPLVRVDPSAWIAPSAQLYGLVEVGAGSSVWHNAVARAECVSIRIGRCVNIQDFVMIHVGYSEPTSIGDFCSITHHATLHGCTLGEACLVGPNAVVMDGAEIGAGSIVAGGAFVPEGKRFPAHSIVAGVPARQIAERDCSRANRLNAWHYHRNAQAYRRGEHRAWDGPDFDAWLERKRRDVERDRDLLELDGLGGRGSGAGPG